MENSTGRNSRWQLWLGILFSLACLAAVFIFIDPAEIWQALREARYGFLFLSFLGILGFLALRAVRWRFMLQNAIPLSQIFHIQNIGYMLTNLLPFRVGELARAVMVGGIPPVTMAQSISTMVVERLLDILFILTLLPFALAEAGNLEPGLQRTVQWVGVVAVGAIIVLIIAANQRAQFLRLADRLLRPLNERLRETLLRQGDEILLGLHSLTRIKDGAYLIFLSIAVWLPILFAYDMALRAVHITPTPALTAALVCFAALVIAAPSSPGQVGVYHLGVTTTLVQILGQPEANAASFAILYHALNFITMVLAGIIGVRLSHQSLATILASAREFRQRKSSA